VSRLGPLRGRDFRLLFVARTTSRLGGSMAPVALAFGVLTTLHGSPTDLGIVLAARLIPTVCFILLGGVLGDRLPRNVVMVGSNAVSGASQAAAAALLLTGHASVASLAGLAAVNGLSSAFFMPASEGIVPQIVDAAVLQEANALLRLSLNATNILGAAIGGLVVAASSPGWAITVDAASFFIAAVATAAMRLPAVTVAAKSVLQDLRDGWHDFWSRTWLWAIVIQFGVLNAAQTGAIDVIGPKVAKEHLGGAAAWGGFLAATSIGLVGSGLLLMRWRPRRLLLVATIACFPFALPLVALAIPTPEAVLIATGLAWGFSSEVFGVMWTVAMQQQIPRERLSRMYSYDMLGSFVLMPLGVAIAGPISTVVGDRATLVGCAAFIVAATAPVLLSRDVRTLERLQPSR
jgi:predicted MFS family arabinose efflux permease